jgi:hypothetical protein
MRLSPVCGVKKIACCPRNELLRDPLSTLINQPIRDKRNSKRNMLQKSKRNVSIRATELIVCVARSCRPQEEARKKEQEGRDGVSTQGPVRSRSGKAEAACGKAWAADRCAGPDQAAQELH